MKYKIEIEEKTYKHITVEADSIEEAKGKALIAVLDLKPGWTGGTKISGYQVGDEAKLGSSGPSISSTVKE